MKKVFAFFVLIFVSSLTFPLEFRLEYEQRSSYSLPDYAFFISDTDIIFSAYGNHSKQLFIMNYKTNEVTCKDLSFIDDFHELIGIAGTGVDGECLIIYSDGKSNSSQNSKFAFIDLSNDSYRAITKTEYNKTRDSWLYSTYGHSMKLHNDIQLWSYSDKELSDISDKCYWMEDIWFKLALIKSDYILDFYKDFGGVNNCKVSDYIQTLKNRKGEDLIFLETLSSVVYDPGREKLVIISSFNKNSTGEYTSDISNFYIYKLIYDATCNDTHVRIREEPNLSCSTLGYLNTGDDVKVTDKSDAPFEIDGESWYWYKVESDSLPDGWVYGKYLDIEE